MLIDNEIEILVNSSIIISKLKKIDIDVKINDVIKIPIEKLWKSSNKKVNVKCDMCDNIKSISYSMYNKNIEKYNLYSCSNKCSHIKNKMTNLKKYGDENYNNLEKSKKTNLEKYGVDNYSKTKEFKVKVKETKLKKYGDENYNNRNKFKNTNLERYVLENYNNRDKFKNTNLERYGVDSYSKTNEFKIKVKETCLERYGVDNYSKTKEFKVKVKETSLERYGVDSPNKCESIKNFKKSSMLEKYGYISNSMTKDSKDRLKNTNLERYGVEYPMQVLEFCEKQQKNSKKIIYYNNDIYYQSSYEKDFLDYTSNINILDKISRGPIIKYNNGISNKIHYPDFYIDEYNLIIEIKSDYYYYKYLEINKLKFNKAIEMGYNYIFIINKNYKYFNEFLCLLEKQNPS
jgi:hypothetical protein